MSPYRVGWIRGYLARSREQKDLPFSDEDVIHRIAEYELEQTPREIDPNDTWYAYECGPCRISIDVRRDRHGRACVVACPMCGNFLALRDSWPADTSGYGSRGCPTDWTPKE